MTTRSCSTYAFNNVEYCDSSENRRDRDDGGMLGLAGAVMF